MFGEHCSLRPTQQTLWMLLNHQRYSCKNKQYSVVLCNIYIYINAPINAHDGAHLHPQWGLPTCMLKLVLHSQSVANPEELVGSQREGGKRKRRLRTKLQPPSLVGHLEPSVVRNVFSLQVV